MKTTKMLSLLAIALMLTWCSTTKISQSDETINTWEVTTGMVDSGMVDSGMVDTETISGDATEVTATGEMITAIANETNAGSAAIDTPATVAEDDALKAKIKTLIEQRKIESTPATKLTEDDIQLMTDVLKAIVDDTNNK